jgi:Lrp/AsnC family leucine-responsive transcriptional regulator
LRVQERGHSWDDTDARLLDILQIDADQTLRELGDQVGLSPSAVQRRLTRYKRRELLRTVAVLDTSQASVVQALVVLTLVEESAEHHRNLGDRLRARPEVQQCYALSGRWDYAVIMAARTLQALRGLGNELFKDDPNIRRYDTMFLLDTVKATQSMPADFVLPAVGDHARRR